MKEPVKPVWKVSGHVTLVDPNWALSRGPSPPPDGIEMDFIDCLLRLLPLRLSNRIIVIK